MKLAPFINPEAVLAILERAGKPMPRPTGPMPSPHSLVDFMARNPEFEKDLRFDVRAVVDAEQGVRVESLTCEDTSAILAAVDFLAKGYTSITIHLSGERKPLLRVQDQEEKHTDGDKGQAAEEKEEEGTGTSAG